MAEKKRIAQELARRATESKFRKRLEQQGWSELKSIYGFAALNTILPSMLGCLQPY